MSASGTDELMFPQQLVAEDSPIGFALLLTPQHGLQGGCTQGVGWLCFQKFPLFCLCYLKKLSAGSDKQEMVPSPTGCSLRREQSMAGPAAHGIYAPAP